VPTRSERYLQRAADYTGTNTEGEEEDYDNDNDVTRDENTATEQASDAASERSVWSCVPVVCAFHSHPFNQVRYMLEYVEVHYACRIALRPFISHHMNTATQETPGGYTVEHHNETPGSGPSSPPRPPITLRLYIGGAQHARPVQPHPQLHTPSAPAGQEGHAGDTEGPICHKTNQSPASSTQENVSLGSESSTMASVVSAHAPPVSSPTHDITDEAWHSESVQPTVYGDRQQPSASRHGDSIPDGMDIDSGQAERIGDMKLASTHPVAAISDHQHPYNPSPSPLCDTEPRGHELATADSPAASSPTSEMRISPSNVLNSENIHCV
jgi:hypothetical protein